MSNRIACAHCGVALHSEAQAQPIIYDEHAENFFCDKDCFVEWAYHTQKPIEYYVARNVVEIDLKER